MTSRIVTLIDMDCFYVQVEEKLNPEVKGTPAVVVQYKPYRGGGIIAVNYEARAKGIKRGGTHGDDAKKICPEVHIFQIPEVRGKADLTRYRDASKDVFKVLTSFSDCVERASIDEAYIDLTDIVEKRLKDVRDSGVKLRDYLCAEKFGNTFASGCDGGIGVWLNKVLPSEESDEDDEMIDGDEASEREFSDHVRLTMGALFVEEMRAAVFEATGFRCSAGISHNKTLSKLGCGLNKPNKQTIMPMDAVPQLFSSMPISKVRNLGGKLGAMIEDELKCNTMSDLAQVPLRTLTKCFDEKTANWLANLAQGHDNEPVSARQLPKSIGCGKNFRGPEALVKCEDVKEWCLSFAEEICMRLDTDREEASFLRRLINKRMAKTMTVGVSLGMNKNMTRGKHLSRSCPLACYSAARIGADAYKIISKINTAKEPDWAPPVISVSIAASNFELLTSGNSEIMQRFFTKEADNSRTQIAEPLKNEAKEETPRDQPCSSSKEIPVKKPFFAAKMEKESDPFLPEKSQKPSKEPSRFLEKTRYSSAEKHRKPFFASNSTGRSAAASDIKPNSSENGDPRNESGTEEKCIQLLDIFPNISDLNEEILLELPLALRKEAEKLLSKKPNPVDEAEPSNLTEIRQVPQQIQATQVFCPDCKTMVDLLDFDQHKDFHLATMLQKEFDARNTPVPVRKSMSAFKPKAASSRKSINQSKITKFFKKP